MTGQVRAMSHAAHTKVSLAQRRQINQLHTSNEPGAVELAAVLDACTLARPCRSAACPRCGQAVQVAAVALAEEAIRAPARDIRNRITAITVVPPLGCVQPDEFSVETFEQVGADITAALAALDLPPTIIGLEASFNEDATGRLEDHWCGHGHLIQCDWLSAKQERALKDRFPPSRQVRRPVHCDRLDRRNEGLSYPFKPERVRRVTVLKEDHPTRAPYRESKRRELRAAQAVSLALVEHQLGFGRRLLTHGIDERLIRQRLQGVGWARDSP